MTGPTIAPVAHVEPPAVVPPPPPEAFFTSTLLTNTGCALLLACGAIALLRRLTRKALEPGAGPRP